MVKQCIDIIHNASVAYYCFQQTGALQPGDVGTQLAAVGWHADEE